MKYSKILGILAVIVTLVYLMFYSGGKRSAVIGLDVPYFWSVNKYQLKLIESDVIAHGESESAVKRARSLGCEDVHVLDGVVYFVINAQGLGVSGYAQTIRFVKSAPSYEVKSIDDAIRSGDKRISLCQKLEDGWYYCLVK